jgi:rubrerythrin
VPNFIERLRADLNDEHVAIDRDDVRRLLDLTERLARRYAGLSEFRDRIPLVIHPGQHRASEISTHPESRAFFELLGQLMAAERAFAQEERQRSRFTCQCCGLPTLDWDPATRDMETCPICHWDQEFIKDPSVPTGGPNGPLSLAEAWTIFDRTFTMYDKGDVEVI